MSDAPQQLESAKKYGYLLLKFRPRSVSEFKERLTRHGFSESLTDTVTDDFKRRGLLDDAKFAKLWVQDRMHLKPLGRLKLRLELEAKGLGEADIDDAMDGIKADTDECGIARQLAQKRLPRLGGLNKLAKKKRLFEFLKRRGFPYEVIAKVVKETAG